MESILSVGTHPYPCPVKIMSSENQEKSEESILFPGKEFKVEGTNGSIIVVPVGIRQLKKFSGTMAQLMGVISSESVDANSSKGAIVAVLMPHILSTSIDIFEDCIVCKGTTLDSVPHWQVPPMIEYWIIESFGESKKWKPWVAMVETMVERLTGEKTDLLGELSKLSSGPVTPDQTS
tara:strand:- start:6369 stop:6902 length:534 start_codon:yes stop_codon:yes gene_type:complete